MKKILFVFLVFLSVLSFNSCSDKEEKTQLISETIDTFERSLLKENIDAVFDNNQLNGSVSVMKNGKLLYEKSNGFEDFKNKVKIDRNSVFAIGSISKQFTAVLVLLEVEKGSLQTTDKVSKYLKEFQNDTYGDITIHQLLNHSSGINDFGSTLLFKSGTDFNYSNKGYRFLGHLLEQVSGKSYEDLATELFQKANLKHTFTPSHFNDENFANAYVGNATHFSKVKDMPERLAKKNISVPAGGILSTIGDLHHWNQSLYGRKILTAESLKKLTQNTIERKHFLFGKVGYGYGLMSNLNAPESYFHTGYVKGSPSLLIYYPATQTSVVVLSNIAQETSGKSVFFSSHKTIKNVLDKVENTVIHVTKEMMKKLED